MIWSLIKVGIFVGLAAALAFGATYIQDTPGEVLIAFGDREITFGRTDRGFNYFCCFLDIAETRRSGDSGFTNSCR